MMKPDLSKTWIITYIDRIFDDFNDHREHFRTTIFSAAILIDPEVAKFILSHTESTKIAEPAKMAIEYCFKQAKVGFASTLRDTVVIIYSILENGINDLIKSIFLNDPEMFIDARLSKIKINALSLLNGNREQMAEDFCREYESVFKRQGDRDFIYGCDRFCSLLKPITGEIKLEDKHAHAITELAQLRNLFVHKGGIVDVKFLEACGWLKPRFKIGEQIKINHHDINGYFVACSYLVDQILKQTISRLKEVGETSETLRKRYKDRFAS